MNPSPIPGDCPCWRITFIGLTGQNLIPLSTETTRWCLGMKKSWILSTWSVWGLYQIATNYEYFVLFQRHKPLSMKVYHSVVQVAQDNQCLSRSIPCSHFCTTANNITTSCLCPRSFYRIDDNNCAPEIRNLQPTVEIFEKVKAQDDEDENVELFVGIGIGCLLGIIMTVFILYYFLRRNQAENVPEQVPDLQLDKLDKKCVKSETGDQEDEQEVIFP